MGAEYIGVKIDGKNKGVIKISPFFEDLYTGNVPVSNFHGSRLNEGVEFILFAVLLCLRA